MELIIVFNVLYNFACDWFYGWKVFSVVWLVERNGVRGGAGGPCVLICSIIFLHYTNTNFSVLLPIYMLVLVVCNTLFFFLFMVPNTKTLLTVLCRWNTMQSVSRKKIYINYLFKIGSTYWQYSSIFLTNLRELQLLKHFKFCIYRKFCIKTNSIFTVKIKLTA